MTESSVPGSDEPLPDLVEHLVPLGFEETIGRLRAAIEAAGLILFATIDHAQGARDVGLAMPPTKVLIYGHPKGGTPVMLAAPRAALDLPLRVLVRERPEGGTALAFHRVDRVLARYGVPEDVAQRLVPAQRLLLKALGGE